MSLNSHPAECTPLVSAKPLQSGSTKDRRPGAASITILTLSLISESLSQHYRNAPLPQHSSIVSAVARTIVSKRAKGSFQKISQIESHFEFDNWMSRSFGFFSASVFSESALQTTFNLKAVLGAPSEIACKAVVIRWLVSTEYSPALFIVSISKCPVDRLGKQVVSHRALCTFQRCIMLKALGPPQAPTGTSA